MASRWRCCCSISTASRTSTIASATRSATACCRPLPQSATATLGADVLFGRIGGEEFACLMPVGDLGEAFAVADRVRRNFADVAARFADGAFTPTVSVGVTLGLDPKIGIDVLLAIADRALYRAKANGRNRVETTSLARRAARSRRRRAPSIVPLMGPERATPWWPSRRCAAAPSGKRPDPSLCYRRCLVSGQIRLHHAAKDMRRLHARHRATTDANNSFRLSRFFSVIFPTKRHDQRKLSQTLESEFPCTARR